MKAECMARVLEQMVQEGKFADMDEAINSVFRDRENIWQRGKSQRSAMGLTPWTYGRGGRVKQTKKTKGTEQSGKTKHKKTQESDDMTKRLAEEYARELATLLK